MQTLPRELRRSGAYMLPLVGIAMLLGCYWLLADWQEVPTMIASALSAVRWLR